MIRRLGMIAGLAGTAGGLLGSLWNVMLPTPDANIGAGALVVIGFFLALTGAALVGIHLLSRSIHSRAQQRT